MTNEVVPDVVVKPHVPLNLHPDRAFPAEKHTRDIARQIYGHIKDLPIISMHGHVPVEWFVDDTPFSDPASLLVTPDHYLMRMIVSQGKYHLGDFGVESNDPNFPTEKDPREIWRHFCENWPAFRGTPTRYWLEQELAEIFGVTERPSLESADRIYDQIQKVINKKWFRPRELLDRFNIQVIGTTDPAWDTLENHKKLAEQDWGDRILPTFRPDAVMTLNDPNFATNVRKMGEAASIPVTDYASYLAAMRKQRLRFKEAGARATDHGVLYADTTPLPEPEAAALFDRAFKGETLTQAEVDAFIAHMMFKSAEMSSEDGLVMQIHPGVSRGHSTEVTKTFGADKGYDIPVAVEYTNALRPMLEAFGHNPNFRCIVFTIDEDVYTRELAPLAGVYPSMKLGAPWWFIDSPEGMRRFREAATETAGFYNTTGFVDDTRAFCSIPARHDLARRIDAGFLARLVAEHRLELDEAIETAVDLTYRLPLAAYAAKP